MDYDSFLARMVDLKRVGFVESHRVGDTGIGKTLEDLLGITENNIAGPDFATYELKSARRDSSSMLTLFTKAPMPKGANHELLDAFGYRQRKKISHVAQGHISAYLGLSKIQESDIPIEEKELHVTVDSLKLNSVGLKLEVKGNTIYISNLRGIEAYYEENYLREAFEKKYRHDLVYVLANNRKEGRKEYFHFNEAQLLSGFSFERFSEAVRIGTVKLDIRIGHYPNGKLHDHGTGFRVFPISLPLCFARIKKIL